MKEKFLSILKEHDWKDDNLRWLACDIIPNHIPEYFWTTPSSITGKYHPTDSLGEGGLVRHTIKVIQMGLKMSSADTTQKADEVMVACAFHDITKYGIGNNISDNRQDFFTHPRTAKNLLWDIYDMSVYTFPDDSKPAVEDNELSLNYKDYRNLAEAWKRICDAVERHYAVWGRGNGLPIPQNRLDFIVSHADLIASMKEYISVEYKDLSI